MNNRNKIAVITGVNGQDGSYLAEFLLAKGYEIHGFVRPISQKQATSNEFINIRHLVGLPQLTVHHVDVADEKSLKKTICEIGPSEIYHLAAQSHTPKSFEDSWGTFQTNTQSTLAILSLIKDRMPSAKFYFAASSELFGDAVESPQNEHTPFNPISPYGISKVAGFYLTKLYRKKYSIFACSGICFSHESPRRGEIFVTRKITSTAARIKYGLAEKVFLGNLETRRDWGYSGDFVEAIWAMLQHRSPDDYVIGTEENHTIQEFVERVFDYLGLDWKRHVVVDPSLYRPAETNPWLADATKARRILGWSPKTSFKELIKMMIENDLEVVRRELVRDQNECREG
ncbi:GDP-mannose 4,6-dehydratase [Nitrospira moscoviensis]|uniref:GDP-mannose 4,6-dehydratase n=1 Tax=Nitrospira moscoviensis TaxID=42253 RepID=A0A0K2GG12_NITMO|nr:GDP-mannose 4,6-dehydratase [Nitrospira moscoviensis]ALA59893.1 GDP-mannose 4,6 dehydratase 2 [Nitrospira moscoviensis]